MTPREFKKLQAEKLKEQKIKPIQKVSNTFIDSALHKSNLASLKTIYYLSTILDKFDHSLSSWASFVSFSWVEAR